MFLANYVPKCQMSSGPYGPIFVLVGGYGGYFSVVGGKHSTFLIF